MTAGILAELKLEFPSFRLTEKTGWFWLLLDFFVIVFTFGKNREFLTGYITTIGPVIAVPEGWLGKASDNHSYLILTHEREHIRQFKKLGLGSVWLGVIPMGFAYLLLPFPLGLAWFRYAFERVAYLAEAKAMGYLYGTAAANTCVSLAVEQLTGPKYGWAWPFPTSVRKWFEERL